jgi:hypothetical protein
MWVAYTLAVDIGDLGELLDRRQALGEQQIAKALRDGGCEEEMKPLLIRKKPGTRNIEVTQQI